MVSREIDEFFKKFVNDFSGIGLKWNMPDTLWTERIFKYLAKVGKSLGFTPYCENNPVEYLLDMCWVYVQESPPINWIEVGFEVEFSKNIDSITDEFSKLVDTKAYTKVLICTPKVDETDELMTQASEMIRYNPFRFPEEHYLIIAITETRQRFFITGICLDYLGNAVHLGLKEFKK